MKKKSRFLGRALHLRNLSIMSRVIQALVRLADNKANTI